jgi:hypothetical protein
MLAFYRLDGPFVAAAIKEPQDGVSILGDFQYLMQLTDGCSSWDYLFTNFAQFDDGTVRVVVLPDGNDCPPSLDVALQIQADLNEFNWRVFDTFEFIGPMLMALFPSELENWIATTDQTHRANDFAHDVQKLRGRLPSDYSDLDYGDYSDWHDAFFDDFVYHYVLEISSKISVTGEQQKSMLIQLAPGDWVELGGFDDVETPTVIYFHRAEEGELAVLIARWIESQHGGYGAAVALLVKPDEESDEEDDDLWERIDEMKGSFWGVSDNCSLKSKLFVVGDEELIGALVRLSPQFAEFKRIIETPDGEEYRLLLDLAKREHPGFGGQMGLFADWSTT